MHYYKHPNKLACRTAVKLLCTYFDDILQTIQQLEKEILRGQSFQGPLVAREIYTKLKERNRLDRYEIAT